MLISKTAIITWNSKIKKHYVELGYVYTKMGDAFEVNVKDLTYGSSTLVDVECDYCHKRYQKSWRNYLLENSYSNINKDSCNDCKSTKTKESVRKTYGCDNVFQMDEIKDKIKKTNLDKYGVENPFQSDEFIEKIKQTNFLKYGESSYMKTKESKEARRKYNLLKYDIPYSPNINITHQKGEKSPTWKGGAQRNGLYRLTYQYRDWRDFILKRDNYTCQCCGSRNGQGHRVQLHVHHIFNYADNPDMRFETDNGICLCKKCHYEFHSQYGTKNTNDLQLDNFILNHGKKIC